MKELKEIFRAIGNFQNEVPIIHKGTKGYGYSYADLPTILEIINPLLRKNGLCFSQPIIDGKLKTILFHIDSGEHIESIVDIPKDVSLKGMNDFQVLGSSITYLRRYSLSSLLGLVTDKDNDAYGEQKVKKTKPDLSLTDAGFDYLINKGTKEDIELALKERKMTKEQSDVLSKKIQ